MYDFSIGVMLDSFRTDIPTALKKAVNVGAQGIRSTPPTASCPLKSWWERSARNS